MIKVKILTITLIMSFFINGCDQILEPIVINIGDNKNTNKAQENFDINIRALNFKTAAEANKYAYPRQLMQNGSASNANVFDEKDFLVAKMPIFSKKHDYIIGKMDKLLFTQSIEFLDDEIDWPINNSKMEYLLDAGDELTYVQSSDPSTKLVDTSNIENISDLVVKTSGIIGSNGNILLLGLGNIKAAGRSLGDVRTEVRNILLRNGNAPNFQLEITQFVSKKAFLSVKKPGAVPLLESKIIQINNIPTTLKEVSLMAGVSGNFGDKALIKLSRETKHYNLTAGQLFSLNASNIFIQDKDQIEIEIASKNITNAEITVGANGNIFLPEIGTIYVDMRTIRSVRSEIKKVLLKKGYKQDFQLSLLKSNSKKAYLINKNLGNVTISLPEEGLSLKNLVLSNKQFIQNDTGLSVIKLKRKENVYQMTLEQIIDLDIPDIWIEHEDQIEVKSLEYKLGQVFALSGAGKASIVPIHPAKRETLADVLFVQSGALQNTLAKRSEVYLLRGTNKPIAYHLDAQNVSRILVAAKTELRPNDIIFVADRPIISFARTLAEITPLRILLRDIENGNIP